jgi:hypothetical protein
MGCALLCLCVWYVSGVRHNPVEWSHLTVRMNLSFSCTVDLCLSKLTLYPAWHSWPTISRLLLRSSNTCALFACSFSVGRFSLAVLQERIVPLFDTRTMDGGLFSFVNLQGDFLMTKWCVHLLLRIAVFEWAVNYLLFESLFFKLLFTNIHGCPPCRPLVTLSLFLVDPIMVF